MPKITAEAYRRGEPHGDYCFVEDDTGRIAMVALAEPDLDHGKVALMVWDTDARGRWTHGPHRRILVDPSTPIGW